MRNESKICKLTTEDNEECVHAIFRNKSVSIPLQGEKRRGRIKRKIWDKKVRQEGLRGLESWDRVQRGKGEGAAGRCKQGQAAIN